MSDTSSTIPVVLFAYARPAHLARVLACLRENGVPLLHVFADGAKGQEDQAAVRETRALLRSIDWCEVRLVERAQNLGLGRNVLAGVTAVAAQHDAFIVWEDDLICVPGTYAWMTAALQHYAKNERVMSVTGWTHPRIIPSDVRDVPYFDGRAECWVWGGYARSWEGMEQTAREKILACGAQGLPPDAYGADLPEMAEVEMSRNIWAVRWLYHHIQHGGLCLRPPWSMVEHIGFDASATNAVQDMGWGNPPLRNPPMRTPWPTVTEHPGCRSRWQAVERRSVLRRLRRWLRRKLGK
ncbi:MAG: hypothetical protein ABIZ81_06085 [Opitutaceae bacterium]